MALAEPALSLPKGVLEASGRGSGSVARTAPGIVALLRRGAVSRVVSLAGGAEMVAQQEDGGGAPGAHRRALTAGVVVFDQRARAAGPLEMVADVVRGHSVHYGLHPVAVALPGDITMNVAGYPRVNSY